MKRKKTNKKQNTTTFETAGKVRNDKANVAMLNIKKLGPRQTIDSMITVLRRRYQLQYPGTKKDVHDDMIIKIVKTKIRSKYFIRNPDSRKWQQVIMRHANETRIYRQRKKGKEQSALKLCSPLALPLTNSHPITNNTTTSTEHDQSVEPLPVAKFNPSDEHAENKTLSLDHFLAYETESFKGTLSHEVRDENIPAFKPLFLQEQGLFSMSYSNPLHKTLSPGYDDQLEQLLKDKQQHVVETQDVYPDLNLESEIDLLFPPNGLNELLEDHNSLLLKNKLKK